MTNLADNNYNYGFKEAFNLNNKIKNIARKGISLVLALGMMMPTGAYAGTHTVNNWDGYREKLKSDIMKQESPITINIVDSVTNTPFLAYNKIKSEYEETINNIPTHLGELNIVKNDIYPEVAGTLKSVTHEIEYKISSENFLTIRPLLNEQYTKIKTKVTDYEKIKFAFDFAVDELKKTGTQENPAIIKEALKKQGDNDHAFLIAMMMTDLGYENDIASVNEGSIGYRWNLVKIQGKWYHVDGRAEHFLISKNEDLNTRWSKNFDKYGGISLFPSSPYIGSNPTVPQLIYEVGLVIEEIADTLREIRSIPDNKISIEQIREAKIKFETIEEKVKNYEERKNIIKEEVNKTKDTQLKVEFTILEKRINEVIPKDIKLKKDAIVDNSIEKAIESFKMSDILDAKEATGIFMYKTLEEEMIALETAIVAIENAEETKLEGDIGKAKEAFSNITNTDLRQKLEARIEKLEAYIEAEKVAINVLEKAIKIVEDDLINNKKISEINNAFEAILLKIKNIESIPKQLQDRIGALKIAIAAIESVEVAKSSVSTIPAAGSLADIIKIAEANIKYSKAEVKKIKDETVRTNQDNRIKVIENVLTAIKAVNKAEATPKMTNVNLAKDTIANVNSGFGLVKTVLTTRVQVVIDDITAIDTKKLEDNATLAVVKAESSLKRIDYNNAKTLVDKLKNPNSDLENAQSPRYRDLNNRIIDNFTVISLKEAVENTETLMRANKSDVSTYQNTVDIAIESYKKTEKKEPAPDDLEYVDDLNKYKDDLNKYKIYMETYKDRLVDFDRRIKEMETAINAIEAVNDANELYLTYLSEPNDNNKKILEETINGTVTSVGVDKEVKEISDNNASLLSIKKSLVARLKVFSDKLKADGDYSTVSGRLNDIEINLVRRLEEDTDIEERAKEIDTLEKSMLAIAESTKSINDKNNSIDLKNRTLAINNAIAAAKAVVEAEASDAISVSKKITIANKAIEKLSNIGIYIRITEIGTLKSYLQDKINELTEKIKTETDEANAKALVEKAISSKKESDIKAAINAVINLEDETIKSDLKEKIVNLIDQLINEANSGIKAAISSIQYNDKSFTTKVTDAKKSVALAVNAIIAADDILKDLNVNDNDKYKNMITDLNKDIVEIDKSVTALKAVLQADKSKTEANVIVADTAIEKITSTDGDKYDNMIDALMERVEAIKEYLKGLSDNEEAAIKAVIAAEDPMQAKRVDGVSEQFDLSDFKYDAAKVQTAKTLIKNVFDKNTQKDLNERILALETAQAAIVSFNKAKVYPIEKNIKDSEAARDMVGGDYFSLVEVLNMEIAKLYENLNESKSNAYKAADDAIKNSTEVIKKLTEYMAGLIKAENLPIEIEELEYSNEEGFDKDIAYGRIRVARNFLMYAEDSVQMLTNSTDVKSLTNRVKLSNEQIDLADDKIDVKEAIRLVNVASESVNKAKNPNSGVSKEEADYDITAAKLALAIIEHKDNKEIKTTITKNLNLIEKRLTSNNDQELIEEAYKLVNIAANKLADAVAADDVKNQSGAISDAIWAANLAIVGISDDNKEVKIALMGFLDEISEIFALDLKTLSNEVRISNARTAVEAAEKYEGNNEDEKYALIKSARLRVSIIINLNSDTKVIIDELNLRLDILEGKTGGGPGTGGDSGNNGGGGNGGKPGGSNGANKPGGSTTINIVPTAPLPDSKRVIGTTEPIWGKTKELKKTNPTIGLSIQEMTAFKVNESKLKTIELSNILSDTSSTSTTLIIRGKTIKLDSKPYINDKLNNSILLPVKLLGDEVGFTVTMIDNPLISGAKRILINGLVNGQTKSIIMDIGSEYAYVNGNLVKISSKPVIQDRRTYIPVDFMVEHLGVSFSHYNQSGNIQLIIN